MLIRSQDKLKLISLDGIKYLEIEQGFSADEKSTVWAVCGDDEATVIGVYSTQKKAQAVMDEIAYNYERNKDAEYFGASMGAHSCIFQMPDDNERWLEAKISKSGQKCEEG